MNNIFNIKRFGLAFRKDILENWKRYTLLFLTLFGLMVVVTLYQTRDYCKFNSINGNLLYLNESMLNFLSILFFAAGIWFASTFATPMNSKLKRLSYLVTPASNLEKYLTRWIITTIGFVVAFFVALWMADLLRVSICVIAYPDIEIKFIDIPKYIHDVAEKSVFFGFLHLYFLLQSLFLLGATVWEKASFIKTFTAVAAFIGAFIVICRWTILLFYENIDGYGNVIQSFELSRTLSQEQALLLLDIIMAIFTLTFWILAFFRIRESEITKRI